MLLLIRCNYNNWMQLSMTVVCLFTIIAVVIVMVVLFQQPNN